MESTSKSFKDFIEAGEAQREKADVKRCSHASVTKAEPKKRQRLLVHTL